MVAMSEIEVRRLTAENWDPLAGLFGEGGDPKRCWCMFWRKPNAEWSKTDNGGKREALRELANGDGLAPGLVALRDGRAVGWISLGRREDFGRLARSKTIPQPSGEDVWSVVCFVVGRESRRAGVTSTLLEAAIEFVRANGARVLEAYPVRTDGARMSSASGYTGILSVFERAGFEVVSETTSNASGLPRVVARRSLA